MTLLKSGFVIALTGALISCASTADVAEPPKSAALLAAESAAELDADACLRTNSINGYSVIDDRHLILDGPGTRQTFLITTTTRCWDLDWSFQLAVKSRAPGTCLSNFDQILTREDSCFIDRVERVKDLETAKALVAARAADRAAEKDAAGKVAQTKAE